jgi:hypothetical protein
MSHFKNDFVGIVKGTYSQLHGGRDIKQFLAFYGYDYYPGGGMSDFIGSFDSKEEAIKSIFEKNDKDHPKEEYGEDNWNNMWGHVWCSEEKKIVWVK